MEVIQNEEQKEEQVEDSPTTITQSSTKQISRKFTFAISLLLILAMCIFWLISSFNTQNLLRVKWVLKKSNSEELKELVEDVLNCTRPDQVKFRVNRYILNIGAAGILRAGK